MKRSLPITVQRYAQSPTFTHETVPESLLKCHNLKLGTWGRLTVEQGTVTFNIEDQTEAVGNVTAGNTFFDLY